LPSVDNCNGDNFWNNCNVTAYFTKDFDIPGVVEMVSAAMELPATPRYSVDLVADRDWVREVQRGWRPILIDDLLLRFPWHSAADISAYLDSQGVHDTPKYELTLEGGMAFGTGEHSTTRLCCSWLGWQRWSSAPPRRGGWRSTPTASQPRMPTPPSTTSRASSAICRR